MYDGQEAVDYRLRFPRHRNKLDPEVVAVLQEMLVQVNALVEASQGTVSAISANTMRLKLLERRPTTSSPPPHPHHVPKVQSRVSDNSVWNTQKLHDPFAFKSYVVT
ncbi:hypothetical protein POM88_033448 [Heracleum sosnowskyi]|uniref:Uncharacterized protein n=1 Tax=Heracleum sosnowskyi TaxID=360622 RepID=A0AAD8I238_9APIA|nr:hypothetical protein POM88_033448 [Heracleum sosnowskyi]